MRELLAVHSDIRRKLASLESKYDAQFKSVFDAIKALMASPEDSDPDLKPIPGFKPGK